MRLLVLDHDGVLTDNHVYTNQHGEEMCRYYRGDGIGIERVKALGVQVICLSSEVNPVVAARCKKLRVICWQGCGQPGVLSKLATLQAECRERGLTLGQVAYIGNDINDLECMEAVGFPFAPKDAEEPIRLRGREVNLPGWEKSPGFAEHRYYFRELSRNGGEGCVREACDLIADAKEAKR